MKVVQIEASPAPPQFNPLGGVAVIAKQHVGGDAGPQGAQDRVGRRPERAATTRSRTRTTLEEAARKPGQGRSQRRRLRRGRGRCREAHRGRVLHAAPRARDDGAAGGDARASPTASARSGVASSRRRPRATWSPSGSACQPTTSPCTSRCSAAGSDASPSPTSASRRRCCRRRWTASRSRSSWTRDDDLHNYYFHTVSVEHLEAGVDAQGKPVAWLHRTVAPTIISTFDAEAKQRSRPGNSAWASSTCRSRFPTSASRTRRRSRTRASAGSARSRTFRTRSRCSRSSAELAAAAGRDPKDYLLEVIGPRADRHAEDAGRHLESRRVARALSGGYRPPAARRGDWSRARRAGAEQLPKGSGLGIAAHYSFVSYVAAVVRGRGRRPRASSRFRASTSRSTAARPSIRIACARRWRAPASWAWASRRSARSRFKDGRAQQNNFDTYEVTRMSAAPREIRVHIVAAATTASRWAAWASPACRRFRLRCATRSSRRRASGSGELPIRDQLKV